MMRNGRFLNTSGKEIYEWNKLVLMPLDPQYGPRYILLSHTPKERKAYAANSFKFNKVILCESKTLLITNISKFHAPNTPV